MIRIDGWPVDIAREESYSFESEATKFPIEGGALASDHILNDPVVITLECVVSDSPIGVIANDPTRLEHTAGDLLRNALPAADTFARLVEIRNARRPVTVECSRGTFDNMTLSFTVPESIETSGGLQFTATLTQLEFIENRRVMVKVAVPTHRGKADRGRKPVIEKDQRLIIWRKGKPPGGKFSGMSEVVFWSKRDAKSEPVLYHADKKTPLTDAELDAFTEDMFRDQDAARAAQVEAERKQSIQRQQESRAEWERIEKLRDEQMIGPAEDLTQSPVNLGNFGRSLAPTVP